MIQLRGFYPLLMVYFLSSATWGTRIRLKHTGGFCAYELASSGFFIAVASSIQFFVVIRRVWFLRKKMGPVFNICAVAMLFVIPFCIFFLILFAVITFIDPSKEELNSPN